MEHHFATVWEALADTVGEQTAQVQGSVRRTWAAFEDRAARLAGALLDAGLGQGSRVALYLYNSPEYLEAFFACLKIRAVPGNVNYRYLDDELRYLLDDFEADAVVFHASLGRRVERVRPRVPRLRLAVEVADDATHVAAAHRYEDLATGAARAARRTRSPDDVYLVYTGGTTGMPKGVIRPIGQTVDRVIARFPPMLGYGVHAGPEELIATARSAADAGRQVASMPAAPLMHHTGFGVGATPALTAGGRVVLLTGRRFDPDELWDTVERERVVAVTIVGDAFARPMLTALDRGPRRDLGCVQLVLSSGVMFSAEVKAGLLAHLPDATVVDFIASTEATVGISTATAGAVPPTGRFEPFPGVVVVGDDGEPVAPGSGETGLLAVPGAFSGYHNDDGRTALAVREVNGARYTIPGDVGTVEPDGTVTLLGRGSACINTGGEKVFPEEVEEAVKRLPEVEDCLVFGVPDERFGQRVAAVVSLRSGTSVTPDQLLDTLRGHLATYKLPRQVVVTVRTPRTASGKADYPAARALFDQGVSGNPIDQGPTHPTGSG